MRTTREVCCLTVAIISAANAGGCAQPLPTGQFLDEWAQRLDTMGLVPIMPPREDLRVGDMYALSVNPETAVSQQHRRAAANEVAAVTRWGTLPVLTALAEEYRQRPSWPKTPDSFLLPNAEGEPAAWQEPQAQSGSIFDPDEVTTRLRIVGVELFTTVSFTGSSLDNIIPTEAATLVTGDANSNIMAVTMRAGSAESIALSMDDAIGLLAEPAAGETVAQYRLKQPYRDRLNFVADPVKNRVWLQVITEVVYIRSADFAIRLKNETPSDDDVSAAELLPHVLEAETGPTEVPAGDAPAGEEGQDQGEQPSDEDEAPAEPPAEPPTVSESVRTYAAAKLDPLYGAFLRANAINEILEDMDADDVPGGTTRFLSVTDESVALRRIWPRGLAIGVRGLYLEVDATTGDILKSGTLRWPAGVTVAP
ncbi:MAG: hypothetical protein ACYTE6_15675 [Planctomycetota bacterium]|jgi:hypothetical protein